MTYRLPQPTSMLPKWPMDLLQPLLPPPSPEGGCLYFEALEVHPIRLTISFSRTERVNSSKQYETSRRKSPMRFYLLTLSPQAYPAQPLGCGVECLHNDHRQYPRCSTPFQCRQHPRHTGNSPCLTRTDIQSLQANCPLAPPSNIGLNRPHRQSIWILHEC